MCRLIISFHDRYSHRSWLHKIKILKKPFRLKCTKFYVSLNVKLNYHPFLHLLNSIYCIFIFPIRNSFRQNSKKMLSNTFNWILAILYVVIFGRCVVAFDGNEWNSQFEIVDGPVSQVRHTINVLLLHRIVRKQHACRVGRNEYQHMPYGMQIRKIRSPPRVTAKSVHDPANDGQPEHQRASQTQAENSLRLLTEIEWMHKLLNGQSHDADAFLYFFNSE